MNKKEWQTEQPVVYRTLSNVLKNKRTAHAFLFAGPKGANKTEAALLFAQSFFCEHPDEDGFACQECDACKRIAAEDSLDFYWHHAIGTVKEQRDPFHPEKKPKQIKQERIKKKDIAALQRFFEETGVSAHRLYILEDFDQATPDAANSLLKFLEEPQPGIIGILIADEKANVLPTIQSRCQWLPFRPASVRQIRRNLEQVMDAEDAEILAQSGYSQEQAEALVGENEYRILKEAAKNYMDHWDSMAGVFDMQTRIFPAKGKLTEKEFVRLWMRQLDYLVKKNEKLRFDQKIKVHEILVESFDVLRSPVDLALFLDRLYDRIRKVVIS
ncbi:hypothetical protein [Catenisphaera adipataccumulans]|uniref:DNA polymerase-3 subunit delta n=1 Tax=Catenisphaera adipataccumulans TaxID=700500 RepID=A0A7W8FYA9_9FIRM|nr:hypothetical protein [Catenisphaera adipataccumulans]MBB5183817.1 DNA polymerase-3 subunit delta' [Catenisphaera adipataccumulans]